jgi:hypothetical protein
MMITSRILKRLIISGCMVNIEPHGSLSHPVISKRSSIEKILNILLLRQKNPSDVEISIPRKYLRGPILDIRNWSLRWALTKAMYSRPSLVMIMSST